MQVIEPRGPVGTQGRFERQEKMAPDGREFVVSVRSDGRAGEKMRDVFYSVYT